MVPAPVMPDPQEVEEVVLLVVVLAVVAMPLNADGVRPVACPPWPVLHAEQPGRRYEARITRHQLVPVPQGI